MDQVQVQVEVNWFMMSLFKLLFWRRGLISLGAWSKTKNNNAKMALQNKSSSHLEMMKSQICFVEGVCGETMVVSWVTGTGVVSVGV